MATMGRRKTLAAAAESDDRIEALKTLRDKLAESIDNVSCARDLAPLSSRFMEVLDKIAEAEPTKANVKKAEVTRLELIAGKRDRRRNAAEG